MNIEELKKLAGVDKNTEPSMGENLSYVGTAKAQYQRNRKTEYPDIGDQLDDLFKAGAFSDDMTAKIKAVKDKYPKG